MNSRAKKLSRRYVATLRKYLTNGQEAVLARAYELGRSGIGQGLGVLDMARIHEAALCSLFQPLLALEDEGRVLKIAEAFFLESLSPFEATHRGFHETNARLQQLNVALGKRNRELGTMNRRLAAEIEERKKTEKALRESERRYSRLIETAEDVIFFLTPEGLIVSINRAFETITGWRRRAWLGKPFAPLLHPDDVGIAVERFHAILRGMPSEQWEYRVRKAGGQYVVGEFTLTREMRDGRCVGIFGIGRDITERKRAEEALRNLSNKVIQVQEEERKRISRDLHDVVGQALTAISVNLAAIRNNGLRSEVMSRTINGTQQLLQETMDSVHHFARELRPAMLDELGLLPTLRSHIGGFAARTGLRVSLHANPIAESLADEQKTALFRIAQESLTNVAKHAGASRVAVVIRKTGDKVCMEIADNGKSFREDAANSARRRHRLGLLGMQERVRQVNGQFAIKPRFGRGTTVQVTLPLPAANSALNGKHLESKPINTKER